MSDFSNAFLVRIKKPACIADLSEDDLQAIANALEIVPVDPEAVNFVKSTGGVQTKFVYGSDGNFNGVYAKIDGQSIPIIPGVGSKVLGLFKDAPSGTNPGVGWEIEVELTKKYFGGADDQSQWEIFVASRVGVINTF